jgi:hypothetical protein
MKYAYLLALLPLATCSTPKWEAYPIDAYLTVQLPAKPRVLSIDSTGVDKVIKDKKVLAPIRAYGAKDSYGVYSVVVNTAPPGVPIDIPASRDSLYAQGIRNTLRVNQGSRLLSKTMFNTPVGVGIAVKVAIISPNTGSPELVYNRTLLTKHRTYAFTFSPSDEDTTAGAAQRRRFFDSITVKP